MTPEHATPHRSKLLESNDPENGRCDEKPNVVRPHEFHFLRCRTRDFVHKVATQSHFQLVCQFARINRTGLFAVLPDFRHYQPSSPLVFAGFPAFKSTRKKAPRLDSSSNSASCLAFQAEGFPSESGSSPLVFDGNPSKCRSSETVA